LKTGLGGLLQAAATRRLAENAPLEWRNGYAVCVGIAADGYPAAPRAGDTITGADGPGYYHAGTALNADGALVAKGGRVLCCSALGETLHAARDQAYALVER